jgi:DNA-binding CsgD family transcriptional regulator
MALPVPLDKRAEIKKLAVQGLTSKEIAIILGLSVHVVRKWRKKRLFNQKWAVLLRAH